MKIYIKRSNSLPLLLTIISVIVLFLLAIPPCVSVILPESLLDILRLIVIAFPLLAGLMVDSTRFTVIWMLVFIFLFHILLWFAHWQFFIGTFLGYMRISLFFWAPLFLARVLLALGGNYQKIFIFYVVLICITVLTTVIGCIRYPDASRLLASGTANDYRGLKNMYSLQNIGGYDFVYSLLIALPMFYCKAKTDNRVAFLYYILIILGLCVAIVTQYTTAILLFAVFMFFIILIHSKSPIRIFSIVLIALLLFWIFKSFIAVGFQNLGNQFQEAGSNTIAERLYSISRMLSGKELSKSADADIIARQEVYLSSLETFLKYPFFGIWNHAEEFADSLANYQLIGGHSDLFDTLAAGGLVSGGLFACLYSVHIKNIKRMKENMWLYKCSLIGVVLFFIVFSINTVFTSGNIGMSMFLLPVLLFQKDPDQA